MLSAYGFPVIRAATRCGVVMLSGIRRTEEKPASIPLGIERGALAAMPPVVMVCAAAGLGLLPGVVSSGIGVQAQRPLTRVVSG